MSYICITPSIPHTHQREVLISILMDKACLFITNKINIPQEVGHSEEFASYVLLSVYSPQAAGNKIPRD